MELKYLVQSYPYHPERFTHLWQVLCKEHLTEHSYWEVEWTSPIEIVVCYEDIVWSDYFQECAFGYKENAWSLDSNKNYSCFRHNDVEIFIARASVVKNCCIPGSQHRCSSTVFPATL